MATVAIANTTANISGKTVILAERDHTITGSWTFDRDPSAPFTVTANSAVVTNLDADKVDGKHSTDVLLLDGTQSMSAALNLGATGQVIFPATQSASGGANTLDDYEEGTWTPVLGGSGGTSGQTYSVQSGTYVKIGQFVMATFRCDFTAKGTITGNLQVQGLPFTVNGGPNVLYQSPLVWSSTASAYSNLQAQQTNASGTTALIQGITAASTAFTTLVTGDIGNATIMGGTLIYRAAA